MLMKISVSRTTDTSGHKDAAIASRDAQPIVARKNQPVCMNQWPNRLFIYNCFSQCGRIHFFLQGWKIGN